MTNQKDRCFSRERLRRVLRKKAAVILHLHTFTSADLHLHTFTPADLDLHTFTPADLDLHTFTPADLDLHTLTPADLDLHTLTSADLDLHTFTPADLDLPMLIRSEGVGLRLQNRRERGKNKKQRTKMHFVSDYVV